MANMSELHKKIASAEADLIELRKQLNAQYLEERADAIASVKLIIKTHGLTASDLGLSGKASSKGTSSDKRISVAPKYKDPDSEKTWTGRGKAPAWMQTQLTTGRSKQDFLIQH